MDLLFNIHLFVWYLD